MKVVTKYEHFNEGDRRFILKLIPEGDAEEAMLRFMAQAKVDLKLVCPTEQEWYRGTYIEVSAK